MKVLWLANIIGVAALVFAWLIAVLATGSALGPSIGAGLVGLAAVALTSGSGLRALWFNVAVSLALIGAFLAVFEATQEHRSYSLANLEPGSYATPILSDSAEQTRGTLTYDGKTIFDVVYTVDRNGLRTSPAAVNSDTKRCVLLFGCSFVFGVGVGDEDTLARQIEIASEGTYRARNFGRPGTGPHHMLEGIENGLVERVADCEAEHAIFVMIDGHIDRATGSLMATGDTFGPRYVTTDSGELVRKGSFSPFHRWLPGPTFAWAVRIKLNQLLNRSVGQREAELTAAMLDQSAQRLNELYPGIQFHTVFWDRDETYRGSPTPNLEYVIRKTKADARRVSEILPARKDWLGAYQIPHDFHPTPLANRLLAEHLVRDVFPAAQEQR